MNKVNKKQVSNDKERKHPKSESYQSLGLKYRFSKPPFWGLAISEIYCSSSTNVIKKTSIDCNQQNAISRNFLYVPRPIFD